MAVSMSIVNLDRSIRTHFDQRISRIQRSMQIEYGGRSDEQNDREDQRTASVNESANSSGHSENQVNEGPNIPTDQNVNQEVSEIPTEEPNSVQEEINATRNQPSRSQSVDVTVEYEELSVPTVSSQTVDNRSEVSDTLDREIRSLSENGGGKLSCCDFYRKHWVGNLITGLFSGFLFILLGIVFLVNEDEFPVYAGIMLIVLGLAPCCMALNRYRYARLYERERHRALQRLNAMRRAHRRHVREERRRQIYSDLPPSYDNLGFELGEDNIEMDNLSIATSTGSFVLPTYEQFMTKYKDKLDRKLAKNGKSKQNVEDNGQVQDECIPPPKYNETDGGVIDTSSQRSQSQHQEFVAIAMPQDSTQIIEIEHPAVQQLGDPRNPDIDRSIATPTRSCGSHSSETNQNNESEDPVAVISDQVESESNENEGRNNEGEGRVTTNERATS